MGSTRLSGETLDAYRQAHVRRRLSVGDASFQAIKLSDGIFRYHVTSFHTHHNAHFRLESETKKRAYLVFLT